LRISFAEYSADDYIEVFHLKEKRWKVAVILQVSKKNGEPRNAIKIHYDGTSSVVCSVLISSLLKSP
jgi:hypothetical protein